jgi:flagellar basal body-associated protein FliL
MAEIANEMSSEAPDGVDSEFIDEPTVANKKKVYVLMALAVFGLLVFVLFVVLISLLLKGDPVAPAPAPVAPSAAVEEADSPADDTAVAAPKKRRRRQAGVDSVSVVLKAFVINLADADAPRYLKVDITLKVIDEDAKKEVEEYTATVRDTVLAYLSGLSAEQTVGPLGKSDMKHAIKKRINDVLPSAPVERVFFTQFIVQWDQP